METVSKFPKYLVDNGLIFEINRKVLHPLGLALVVDVERGNKKNLTITALLATEDQDGFLYDEEGYNIGNEKFQKFLSKEGQKRLDNRYAKYGFIEQDKGNI
jgi:hypothetical protein